MPRNRRTPVTPGQVYGTLEALGRVDYDTRPSVARWRVRCQTCGWTADRRANHLQNIALGLCRLTTGCPECKRATNRHCMIAVRAAMSPDAVARRNRAVAAVKPKSPNRAVAREMRSAGASIAAIARAIGVSESTARKYLRPTAEERNAAG